MNDPKALTIGMLSPHYWPTWLLLGIAWLIVRLPYRWLLALGAWFGDRFRRRSARRRRITDVNLRLSFPDLSDDQRERMTRDVFRSLGIGLLETGMSWWLPKRRIRKLIAEVEGLQYLQQALAGGRGVILLTAHFVHAELGARMLNLLVPIHPMYRVHENPVVRRGLVRALDRYFESSIPRDDVRTMIRCLRNGEAVWYAPDQNYGRKGRVFAPFFGVDAASNPATGRFAAMGNAVVIPYFPQRLPGARGYRLTLLPPLDGFPGDDEVKDTARVNRIIEDEVRRAPEQYLWAHRRFKTRPDGQPGLYGS